jgi:hypothetical protein
LFVSLKTIKRLASGSEYIPGAADEISTVESTKNELCSGAAQEVQFSKGVRYEENFGSGWGYYAHWSAGGIGRSGIKGDGDHYRSARH